MGGTAHFRVEVRTSAASDVTLSTQRAAMYARTRRRALLVVPFVALVLVVTIAGLIRDAEGNEVETAIITIGTLVAIVLISGWIFRRQRRRALNVPGRLWLSRPGLYPGPYDDDGGMGPSGSAAFARRHTGDAAAPIVRLVLTSTALVVVPNEGPDETLHCPLSEIAGMVVTRAGWTDSGITITGRDGRTASFIVRPDDQLLHELQRLGATISPAPFDSR